VDTTSLAQPAHVPHEQQSIREAIRQRTTRGMLTFNTGKVVHLESNLWAAPSTRGGFHQVDLAAESCDCEDWTFYAREHGIGCRHVFAAAIASASRRSGVREVRTIRVAAGDPIAYAAKRDGCPRDGCPACFAGFITMTVAGEDGQERDEAVPCRRCQLRYEGGR
jgi:hypothetical protein